MQSNVKMADAMATTTKVVINVYLEKTLLYLLVIKLHDAEEVKLLCLA